MAGPPEVEGNMPHPYQCLLYCYRPEDSVSQILIAASGAYIHAFDVSSGQHLSCWPPTNGPVTSNHKQATPVFINEESDLNHDDNDSSQQPSKRRKTSLPAVISTESSSAEIVVEGSDDREDFHSNPVIKLAATSKGRHLVAVTGEDKCMRVFELTGMGTMHQLSERIMPKKPCAVRLTPDDSAILCADKFGDVFSLPLLGQPRETKTAKRSLDDKSGKDSTKTKAQKFIPSATSLTVHTKRNLNALKQQQNLDRKILEKRTLSFDHELILGHVSLLTDVVCASVSANPLCRREYILTSDRDEHIRVSRGIPQAHVIEGYCLGHTQFVSKLCLIPSEPTLLISGGGDGFLLLWNWLAGTIKQRIALWEALESFMKLYISEKGLESPNQERTNATTPGSANESSLAVSNIQILEMNGNITREKQTEVIITCEVFREAYSTDRNVLDVVVLQDQKSIVYSMDNIHPPFSTTDDKRDATSTCLVKAIHFLQGPQRWEDDLALGVDLLPALEMYAKSRPMVPQKNVAKGKSLKELLYGLETLRKRGMGTEETAARAAENETAAE